MFAKSQRVAAILCLYLMIPCAWAASLTLLEQAPRSDQELHVRVDTDLCLEPTRFRLEASTTPVAQLSIAGRTTSSCGAPGGTFDIGKWPPGKHELRASISLPGLAPRYAGSIVFYVSDRTQTFSVEKARPPREWDRGLEKIAPPPNGDASAHKYDLPKPSPPPQSQKPQALSATSYYSLPVFFATDRAKTESTDADNRFGPTRGDTLEYGTCVVSIPKDHRMGEIESPSWWKLQFRPDPEKHIVLLSTELKSGPEFFSSLSAQLKSSKDGMLVFVHGFNVTFDDAAKRTAQLSYDLNFSTPIFFSWPSNGKVRDYVSDQENAEWAHADLRQFLSDLVDRAPNQKIYLLAHSMGSRVLMRAVAELLDERPSVGERLTAIMLAAPDIDAGIFHRDVVPALAAAGHPMTTVYASSRDLALNLSEDLHLYPRLGESGDDLVIFSGVETVDATAIDGDGVLGHSYFATQRAMLDDLHSILFGGLHADRRGGLVRKVKPQSGVYWAFKP